MFIRKREFAVKEVDNSYQPKSNEIMATNKKVAKTGVVIYQDYDAKSEKQLAKKAWIIEIQAGIRREFDITPKKTLKGLDSETKQALQELLAAKGYNITL
ncbi:MAG: hypothetical protein ACOYWZ_15040 [Bacillota bacterium]